MTTPAVIHDLRRCLGREAVLDDAASRIVYARDASHETLGRPLGVVLPTSGEQVRQVVAICSRHRIPFVMRGGGTGLSGGALPQDGAVVIGTSRLNAVGKLDADRRQIMVQPGVVNEVVSRLAAPYNLHFAPDPSSQSAATIGGNIAENAGGPHCLKVGVTAQHVRRLDWVDSRGRTWTTGRGGVLDRGIGLRGLLCGSEGTLGAIINADLELRALPEAAVTLLADFPDLEDATRAVVRLMGSGIVPEACEIVDRGMLLAVEEAFHFGFPTDVEAVMICELAGKREAAEEDAAQAETLLRESGAREVHAAADEAERTRLWMCRKKAFGAVGRLAPAYISMDVVVPLGSLTTLVRDIQEIKTRHCVEVATAFHAGDGNLHPGIHYDDRDPEVNARAHQAADAIVMRALELGGSCTGEHGVGTEKRHLVHHQLDQTSLKLMHGIKNLFDPAGICNPGKLLPDPGIEGTATEKVPSSVAFHWDSLTVTAPAEAPLAEIQAEALTRGLWIPVGGASRKSASGPGLGGAITVGEMIAAGTPGPSFLGHLRPSDAVLELWAETGRGDVLRTGAPVLKNVAGYDLVRLLVGSGHLLARPLAATLQLKPVPACVGLWTWPTAPEVFGGEGRREFQKVLLRHENTAVAIRERALDRPSMWVLAAGRDRDWDLGRLGQDLEAWSEDHGLGRPTYNRRDPADLASLKALDGLPAWACAAADWTLLSAREEKPDWPRPQRLIWQTQPSLIWTPQVFAEEPVGWRADNVFRDGRLQDPPRPVVDVPLSLLAGLKRLFDPDGRLPSPPWLTQAQREAAP